MSQLDLEKIIEILGDLAQVQDQMGSVPTAIYQQAIDEAKRRYRRLSYHEKTQIDGYMYLVKKYIEGGY
jgi:hypothetical protein